MELVISIRVTDGARPDEVAAALRNASNVAAEWTEYHAKVLAVDEQIDLGADFVSRLDCAQGLVFYRSE